ncbi:MAG TPA: hypothetical protein VMH26_00240, partial [Burkholderiales bacterium]|nr:hypothetical protein [Burkholderiales bacterium]
MGKAARPRRKPATEEGVYEVSSFRPLEAVGYLTARVRQTLGDALERELAPLGLTAAQGIAVIGLTSGLASTAGEMCKGMPYDPG